MTYHPSSAVSVASVLTATTVLVLGYRIGRTHAAWRDVRAAKRAVHTSRRHAWGHTARVTAVVVSVLVTMFVAAYDLAR